MIYLGPGFQSPDLRSARNCLPRANRSSVKFIISRQKNIFDERSDNFISSDMTNAAHICLDAPMMRLNDEALRKQTTDTTRTQFGPQISCATSVEEGGNESQADNE